MLKARTKRKNKVREAAERKALEALGWVFIWSSQMTTDCDGTALIFGPKGLEEGAGKGLGGPAGKGTNEHL